MYTATTEDAGIEFRLGTLVASLMGRRPSRSLFLACRADGFLVGRHGRLSWCAASDGALCCRLTIGVFEWLLCSKATDAYERPLRAGQRPSIETNPPTVAS